MGDQNQATEKTGQGHTLESMRQDLEESKARIKIMLDSVSDAIVVASIDGIIETFNRGAEELFGYSADEISGKSVTKLMTPFDASRFDKYVERFLENDSSEIINQGAREVMVAHKNTSSVLVELTLGELSIGSKRMFMATMKDVSDRGPDIKDIHKIADNDPLTGLYNYNYLKMEMGRVMERAKREQGKPCALIYFNIDRFKFINDTMGLDAGDTVLIEIGNRINTRLRGADMAARLSGDEFAILIYDTNDELAEYVGNAFHKFLTEKQIDYEGKKITPRISVGVTIIDKDTKTLGDVLDHAMDARKKAKNLGGNSVMLYK